MHPPIARACVPTEEIYNILSRRNVLLSVTVWPSGLRRWLQAPVRKGVGSNPTAVTFPLNARFFIGNMQESRDAIVCAPTGDAIPLTSHCIIQFIDDVNVRALEHAYQLSKTMKKQCR